MEVLANPVLDNRIKAYNVLCEMSLKEYYDLVKDSMKRNTLQRGRVHSAKSIYSLLKNDLIEGCIMPPIVLSIFDKFSPTEDKDDVKAYIASNKENLIILDGLQRTYTIHEIYNEHISDHADKVLNIKIRVEIYLGLNREGVLYRMLTLNTGQTKMNLRHQVEMIYSDLLSDSNTDELRFLKDTDKESNKNIKTFYFNEAVDAYTSFIYGSYLPITREKLIETIESFSELPSLKYKKDAFLELMTVYSNFLEHAVRCLTDKEGEIERYGEEEDIKPLFGKNAISIFNRSQCMTGFAAAVSRLLELEIYSNLNEIGEFSKMDESNFSEGIMLMLKYLNVIRNISSKIGNSQRCFFYYIFKNLLDKTDMSRFMNLHESVKYAIGNYERDF